MNAYVDRFLQYINKLRNNGIFDKPNQNGLIIVADDQYVNQQAMQLAFEDFDLQDRLKLFSNGQAVLEFLS